MPSLAFTSSPSASWSSSTTRTKLYICAGDRRHVMSHSLHWYQSVLSAAFTTASPYFRHFPRLALKPEQPRAHFCPEFRVKSTLQILRASSNIVSSFIQPYPAPPLFPTLVNLCTCFPQHALNRPEQNSIPKSLIHTYHSISNEKKNEKTKRPLISVDSKCKHDFFSKILFTMTLSFKFRNTDRNILYLWKVHSRVSRKPAEYAAPLSPVRVPLSLQSEYTFRIFSTAISSNPSRLFTFKLLRVIFRFNSLIVIRPEIRSPKNSDYFFNSFSVNDT